LKTIGFSAAPRWSVVNLRSGDALLMYNYGRDYGRMDLNVNLGTADWFNGDFNYDGKINVDDYGIIDFNVGIQDAPFPTGAGADLSGVTAIPEPGSLGLLGFALGFSFARSTRRRRAATPPPRG